MEQSQVTYKEPTAVNKTSITVKAKVNGSYKGQELKKGDTFSIPYEYAGRTSKNLGLRYFNSDLMEIVDRKILDALTEAAEAKAIEPAVKPTDSQAFIPSA